MSVTIRARILNGALAGREIQVPGGELTIGGAEADLAVVLEGGITTKLVVDESGVKLIPPAPCWIDGLPVDARETLPLGVALDVAGCGIALGTPNQSLGELTLSRRRLRHLRWLWPVALGFAVFAGLGAAMLVWMTRDNDAARAFSQREETIRSTEEQLRQAGLTVSRKSTGVLVLSGTCRSSDVLRPLRSRFYATGVPFVDETVCDDELVASVKAILALHGYANATVSAGAAPGTVEISALAAGDARWQKAANALATLNGLVEWRIRDSAAQGASELIGLLRDVDLLGRVSVSGHGDVIFVNGLLDQRESDTCRQVLERFAAARKNSPRVVYQNVAPHELSAGMLESPLVAVGRSAGAVYLQLANGERLKVGSRLKDGYEIVALDADGIDLRRGEELVHFILPL